MTSLFQRIRLRNKPKLEASYSRSSLLSSSSSPPNASNQAKTTLETKPAHQKASSPKRAKNFFSKTPHLDLDKLRHHRVERVDKITSKQCVVIANNTNTTTTSSANKQTPTLSDVNQQVAIRLKIGKTAYSEWLNEINVYLLPDFAHLNLLDFLFAEKCYRPTASRRWPQVGELLGELDTIDETTLRENFPILRDRLATTTTTTDYSGDRRETLLSRVNEAEEYEPKPGTSSDQHKQDIDRESLRKPAKRILTDSSRSSDLSRLKNRKLTPEFWILTDYTGCQQLRDHLRHQTLSWNECLDISFGIASGLHYMHENNEYQSIDVRQAVDKFIGSTNGALKKVSFVDQRERIVMEPPVLLAVIHRNLSSLNVVLCGPNKVAKICNFGQAYIQHPFQPINHNHVIDKATKFAQLTSPYSPPEVLQEKGHLTLAAMKSIDMYAFGVILWEMLSRTRLPIISNLTKDSQRLRLVPGPYKLPFEDELAGCPREIRAQLMEFMVCEERVRPPIARQWQEGKYSNLLVQTIRELWDPDFEARLHSTTILGRLYKLREPSKLHDVKNKYGIRESRRHNREAWTQRSNKEAPIGQVVHEAKCMPNIRFESVPPV